MSRLVFVLNGSNLLGERQPQIYGYETLADLERDCRADGVMAGYGTQGYQLALRGVAKLIDDKAA